jgi:hypothetical protein
MKAGEYRKDRTLYWNRALIDADEEDEEDPDRFQSPDWDTVDNVYRCLDCKFEVADGVCHHCGAEYDLEWVSRYVLRSTLIVKDTPKENEAHPGRSISIDNEAMNDDRRLAPRAITPLLDVSPSRIPEEYSLGRSAEFYELLKRGATCLMCETFHLSFTHETGIIAWADGDIFDTFSGPAMQEGDFWKIHLGRCIELDEDDFDGSIFLEGLLEDILLFPMVPYINSKAEFGFNSTFAFGWETVEETPGIWVTRPIPNELADPNELAEGSDVGSEDEFYRDESLSGSEDDTKHPVLHKDDYESSDAAESDIEMVSDAEDESQDGSVDSETLEDDSSSSSEDSDFDSEDMFSGDERTALEGMKLLEWYQTY